MKTKEVREILYELGAFVGFEDLPKAAQCRGMHDNCKYSQYGQLIPKGQPVLRISNGVGTAYYCSTCAAPILNHIKSI